ncbi:hypothetical protein AABB24_030724, partial [Solanum stoloniferum]
RFPCQSSFNTFKNSSIIQLPIPTMNIDSTTLMMKKLLLFLLLIYMVVTPPSTKANSITCDTVNDSAIPCLNYVTYGGNVSEECCKSFISCLNNATTISDRQIMCSCIKDLFFTATSILVKRTASIPEQCGIKFPFKISKDVDSSKVL